MIGYKIYFEIETGDVILTIPEKHNANSVYTTKQTDYLLFDVLQYRDPETIDFVQLDYGQHRTDFQTAKSWKVNPQTKKVIFEYPSYGEPLYERIKQLEIENILLKEKNELLLLSQTEQDEIIMQLMLGGM